MTTEADDDPALTLWRQLSRPKAAAVAAAVVVAEDSEVATAGPHQPAAADDSEDTDAGPRPPWKGIFGRRGNVRPPYNPDLESFFYRRRELFSKFDRGVRMDAESWFSVTPERLAAHIAARTCTARRGLLVVDPFCGCGGNVIQQALADPTGAVLAIDIDPNKVGIDLHPLLPLHPLCPLHALHLCTLDTLDALGALGALCTLCPLCAAPRSRWRGTTHACTVWSIGSSLSWVMRSATQGVESANLAVPRLPTSVT